MNQRGEATSLTFMTALLCQKGALLIQKEVFNTRKTSTVAQWLAAPSEHKGPVFDSTEKSPGW